MPRLRWADGLPPQPESFGIATQKGITVPTNVPAPGAQGDVCRQSTVTIDLDLPMRPSDGIRRGLQNYPFGSEGWYDSFRRRQHEAKQARARGRPPGY